MHAIRIDRSKPLAEEPHVGHNRFHPDILPALEVEEGGRGSSVETRDALDGQIPPDATVSVFDAIEAGAIHPLTGPIYVKGAEPGDALEIEFLDIEAQPIAFSGIFPGLGFLRDVMTEAYLVHWKIADGWGNVRTDSRRCAFRAAPSWASRASAPSPEAARRFGRTAKQRPA